LFEIYDFALVDTFDIPSSLYVFIAFFTKLILIIPMFGFHTFLRIFLYSLLIYCGYLFL
jgi:hypothetical protein